MSETPFQVSTLTSSHSGWPSHLETRLGRSAPSRLWAIGNLEILARHKIGLFCSIRCPGNVVLAARDAGCKLQEEDAAIVSGFHAPVEKECLRHLLRERQPVIVCLARALGKVRISSDWRSAVESGRLLLLSRFEKSRRADRDTARRRNELVAALSDEVLIVHADPGGSIDRISEMIAGWRIPTVELNKAT